MDTAVVALIIIVGMIVLYLADVLPVALSTLVGALAMVFLGVLPANEMFACFVSDPVLLVLGMVIIIEGLMECGLGARVGAVMGRLVGKSERTFVVVLFLLAATCSLFVTNAALVAMFMPFIAAASAMSDGLVTKKHTYLPLAMGALIGGTGSLAGSTAPLLANSVLEANGIGGMAFFETFPISASIAVVVALAFWLFLYKLEVKWFDFDEVPEAAAIMPGHGHHQPIEEPKGLDMVGETLEDIEHEHLHPIDRRRAAIALGVFVTCIVLFIVRPFGWSIGLISVTGAVVMILTRCVNGRAVMGTMMWPALVTLGAALAVANGFVKSGAGEMAVNAIMGVMGSAVYNPVLLVSVFLVAAWVLSLFMADGSLVVLLASIGVPLALRVGMNPMPMVMACIFGAHMSMATPVATTSITMVQVAGYRFKDYLRLGGSVGLIGLAVAWVVIMLRYGLLF